jgi:DNA segregation ATPase FtsK/SpoIIIE-like protein
MPENFDEHPHSGSSTTCDAGLCYILSRRPPACVKPHSKAPMHPLNPEFALQKLRSQLEEILAIVKAAPSGCALARFEDEIVVLSVALEGDATGVEPGSEIALADDRPEIETACESDAPDDLYDDALVIVTEFGQASPAILQMWLSIDYNRAITILNRFQADGLISSKGKLRHKAFSTRRSLAPPA